MLEVLGWYMVLYGTSAQKRKAQDQDAEEEAQRAEQAAKRKAAVEKFAAEALQRRREVFDLNGRILDLLAGDVLTGEESASLFFHPGVSSLGGWWQQVPEAQRSAISGNPADTLTSDGRWHAVYPPLSRKQHHV